MAQIKTWFCQKIMAFSDRADDRRDGILARRTNDIDDIDGESDHQYFPSPRRLVHTTISNISGNLENLTFVDFGSGMGRVVFCAAKYRFQEVVGVEYLPELHEKAVENEKQFRNKFSESSPISLICDDATNCEIPSNDCLLNFYNPFGEEVFAKVVDRIVDTHQKHGNKIYVCYQQSKNEVEATNTRNIKMLEDSSVLKTIPYKYRSSWDRFLLGIFTIGMFETQ